MQTVLFQCVQTSVYALLETLHTNLPRLLPSDINKSTSVHKMTNHTFQIDYLADVYNVIYNEKYSKKLTFGKKYLHLVNALKLWQLQLNAGMGSRLLNSQWT